MSIIAESIAPASLPTLMECLLTGVAVLLAMKLRHAQQVRVRLDARRAIKGYDRAGIRQIPSYPDLKGKVGER